MTSAHVHVTGSPLLTGVLLAPFAIAALAYIAGAIGERRRGGRGWPIHRVVCWLLALTALFFAVVGPLANLAHTDFVAHTAVHLMVGMLAPLLLVLAAPVTLALRRLHILPARRLGRLLNSPPARFLTHPVPAALLSVGPLWALYATPFSAALADPLLHYVLIAHFFVAGCLFTVSIVSVDPAPHRARFSVRLTVLVLAIAAHAVLAKQIYANPLPGTTHSESEAAGLLMYYGGDAIEFALIVVLFAQTAKTLRRHEARAGSTLARRGGSADI